MKHNTDLPGNNCTHCGDPCNEDGVWLDELPFCCLGCQTVYEILAENDLCDYYEIDQPQLKVKQTEFGEKYAFLDNDEISEKLYKFIEGDQRMVRFFVPNIHCSSCIWLLENLNRLVPGVLSSQVNFVKKEITLQFDCSKSSLRQVVEMMASIGYAPTINLAGVKEEKDRKKHRTLLIKLGIAGFCFGNIMLLSFPEYFSFQFQDEATYIRFFSWLNLLFSLPVIFYAGTDYFVSAWKGLKHKIINIDVPISIGIAVLFLRSTFEIITHTGAGYMDSLSGLVFFLLIGKWFQNKTYTALSFERDYRSYFPLAVTRITEGKEENILINQLEKGNEIRLRNQELIPADSILISESAQIDYSFVTGESEPVEKKKGALIYAGGRYLGSSIHLIVQEQVSQSYLTDLWNQSSFKNDTEPQLSTLIDRVSQYFTIIIISIAILTGVFWFLVDPAKAMNSFTAVLIIACPCALALALPFALGNSIRVLGKNGFFLKNSGTVERLAAIDTIIFDKTGTLTASKNRKVRFFGERALSPQEKSLLASVTKSSTHPLSQGVYQHLHQEVSVEGQMSHFSTTQFEEIPGKGVTAIINDQRIKLGSADFVGVKHTSKIPTVHIEMNQRYLGYFTIQKNHRSGMGQLLKQLTQKGYDLHLLSGDKNAEKGEWLTWFNNDQQLLFDQSPREKLEYVERLNRMGKNTLMIGDGLNDAGALKEAHVGVAISEDVYSFSPACDAILDAGQFERILRYLSFSQKSIRVVKWSFIVSFLYNLVGLSFAVQGILTPIVAAILMPLSSITIVVFVSIGINRIKW